MSSKVIESHLKITSQDINDFCSMDIWSPYEGFQTKENDIGFQSVSERASA
jgi:hypothetical protein